MDMTVASTRAGTSIMTRHSVLGWLFALVVISAGCGKKASESGPRLKDVSDAFTSAGFKLDSFHPIEASRFSAQKCAQGTLEGLDAIVCEFGSTEAVRHGKRAGEAWIAQATTGAVLENGRTLFAVADRAHIDPTGQVIHKLTQTYSRLK
jgi:hypothetical protein